MQRGTLTVLVLMLCTLVALSFQVMQISQRIEARDRADGELLEARVIVLEKTVERLKAKEELRWDTDHP